jgi:hypothetical protein
MLDTNLLKEKMIAVDFPIAIMDIPTIPNKEYRQIRRTDNNTFLGMCKTRYKPITHSNAFGGAIDNMIAGGIDFTDAQINIQSYEFGAMAKMEITLPKHHTKVGDHDLMLKYIARNSYNGRWKFQSFFGWLNKVCFNTLVSGQQLAYSSSRHSLHFDVDASNAKIYNAVKLANNDAKKYNDWWYKAVEDDDVAEMFKKTLCKKDSNIQKYVESDQETNHKQFSTLMNLYEKEVTQIHGKGEYGRNGAKGSLWCAYQSATYWSTHIDKLVGKADAKTHIIQHKRQNAVKAMLNSKSWKDLETN